MFVTVYEKTLVSICLIVIIILNVFANNKNPALANARLSQLPHLQMKWG